MKRKVTKLEIVDGSLQITWDNGDFLTSRLDVDRTAELLLAAVYGISQSEPTQFHEELAEALYG